MGKKYTVVRSINSRDECLDGSLTGKFLTRFVCPFSQKWARLGCRKMGEKLILDWFRRMCSPFRPFEGAVSTSISRSDNIFLKGTSG